MQIRNRFVLSLLVTLVIIVLIFGVFRTINRVQITAFYPDESQSLSSHGRIRITFNQPMNPGSVESHFSFSPPVEGQFSWEGNTLWFTPVIILDPSLTYQVVLAAGVRSQSNRILQKTVEWSFKVRAADILFMKPGEAGGDLWLYSITEDRSHQLTDTDNTVVDFAPSPTGDFIAYTKTNAGNGVDLWLIDRDGNNSVKVVNCGLDLCSEPAWSPDSEWIAYTREVFSPPEGRHLPQRVWMYAFKSGETLPLVQQEGAYGHSPSFSHDGKRLAIYDILDNAIRILDLETEQELAVPSAYPSIGDWSPDGEEFIFIDLSAGVLEPNVGMYIFSFKDKSIRDALGEFLPHLDVDPPRWSPNGEQIAYGARLVGTSAGKGLWVANLESGDALPITQDPSGSFSNYRWDLTGERLVFQRYAPSGILPHTSIWVWDRSTEKSIKLLENGTRPVWIP